ncbi:MAG: 3-hydroxyacyl-CoA dehydrogenase family protein [Solirubrobacteraceae bacterium]
MTPSLIAVAGAGFMGSGIAESLAVAGRDVLLYEPEQAPLDLAQENITRSVATATARGKLDVPSANEVLERIHFTTRIEDLAPADGAIEAVIEDVLVKRGLFVRLDAIVTEAQFLASNTSSIPIAELAAATTRPERVLGLHFFSPVPVMKLVEVVVGLDTSADALASAEQLIAQIGKQAIRTKDRSGFIVNMLLVPYLMAAVRMYEDRFATREDIDAGMQLGCGHPMGPLTLCDFIGLDVLYAVCNSLYEEYKRDEYAPPPLMKRMVASGRLGRKSGRGFYDYGEVRSPVGASG